MVQRITTHEETIDATQMELGKLRWLKVGLTSDLLTGRVCVPETIEAGVAP